MSVRPITVSEEDKAFGDPIVGLISLMGGLQGVLMYLNKTKAPFRSNWAAAPGSPFTLAFFLLGGYFGSMGVAYLVFKDDGLLRLYYTHRKDLALQTAGQKITHIV